ncbi:hypothetical protein [Paludisphaera mucosa]|uniref:Uncharacterized protein n=1 Tax=Paludisphaera mucosa TaxID=3030827 RepID=A0ABT6F4M2_9BACT|nr:hypothetical protein [Paludisphaera mucosa]MDG3002525.1 hypothetical protein [Paludisphaera mucosa]
MSGERRDQPEQEISIKRREHELFVDDSLAEAAPVKPFSEFLRDTPATPLSGGVKAGLWAIALVAALLFGAALWRLVNRQSSTRPARKARSKTSRAAPPKAAWTIPATPPVAARETTPPDQETRR